MLNLYSKSPLSGVHLFNSNTYPSDIGVYWRDNSPIVFEIAYDDTPEAYPNLLDHIYHSYELLDCQLFNDVLISKIRCGRDFWAICDGDTLSFSRTKPFTDTPAVRPSNLMVGVHETVVAQALLAVSFSPVDLAWLTGENTIGLYEKRIWDYAVKHLTSCSEYSACLDL